MKKRFPVVLHLATWYPQSTEDVQGIFVQRHVELLQQHTAALHFVVVKTEHINWWQLLNSCRGVFPVSKVGSCTIIHFPSKHALQKKLLWRWQHRLHQWLLARLIKKYQPSLLHLHVVYGFAGEAMYINEKWGVPFIVSEHMAPFPFTWIGETELLIRQPLKKAAAVAAVSKAQAQEIQAYAGIKPVVISNVVHSEQYYYADKIAKSPSFQIILTGIYDTRKGVDYLLHVMPEFIKQYPDTVLHLAGDAVPQRRKSLEELAAALHIQSAVVFHGKMNAAQLRQLYQQCDFYVCASEWESFGLTMLEALFCGLPVLSTDCGGVHEFLNASNSIVIANDRQPQTMLSGLLQMTHQLSLFNRKEIAADVALQFSGAAIVRGYQRLYELAAHPSPLKAV